MTSVREVLDQLVEMHKHWAMVGNAQTFMPMVFFFGEDNTPTIIQLDSQLPDGEARYAVMRNIGAEFHKDVRPTTVVATAVEAWVRDPETNAIRSEAIVTIAMQPNDYMGTAAIQEISRSKGNKINLKPAKIMGEAYSDLLNAFFEGAGYKNPEGQS